VSKGGKNIRKPGKDRLTPRCLRSFTAVREARVAQAGVVPIDTGAVGAELQKTWNRPDAEQWGEVYTNLTSLR